MTYPIIYKFGEAQKAELARKAMLKLMWCAGLVFSVAALDFYFYLSGEQLGVNLGIAAFIVLAGLLFLDLFEYKNHLLLWRGKDVMLEIHADHLVFHGTRDPMLLPRDAIRAIGQRTGFLGKGFPQLMFEIQPKRPKARRLAPQKKLPTLWLEGEVSGEDGDLPNVLQNWLRAGRPETPEISEGPHFSYPITIYRTWFALILGAAGLGICLALVNGVWSGIGDLPLSARVLFSALLLVPFHDCIVPVVGALKPVVQLEEDRILFRNKLFTREFLRSEITGFGEDIAKNRLTLLLKPEVPETVKKHAWFDLGKLTPEQTKKLRDLLFVWVSKG